MYFREIEHYFMFYITCISVYMSLRKQSYYSQYSLALADLVFIITETHMLATLEFLNYLPSCVIAMSKQWQAKLAEMSHTETPR